MVFITNRKTTCFGLYRPSSGFDNFLATRVIHNMHKLRVNDNDDKISTSTRGLCILYITLIARNLSKTDDGRYKPKHIVFYC